MRRWQGFGLDALVAIGGIGLISVVGNLLFASDNARRIGDLAWLVIVFGFIKWRQKQRNRQLARLWALVDALGYDASELKRRAPQYGRLDWAVSRPDRQQQFFPSAQVVEQLITELTQELQNQEATR